jgi:hypothetical protein
MWKLCLELKLTLRYKNSVIDQQFLHKLTAAKYKIAKQKIIWAVSRLMFKLISISLITFQSINPLTGIYVATSD